MIGHVFPPGRGLAWPPSALKVPSRALPRALTALKLTSRALTATDAPRPAGNPVSDAIEGPDCVRFGEIDVMDYAARWSCSLRKRSTRVRMITAMLKLCSRDQVRSRS